MLAYQHFQHNAIDNIILPIIRHHPDTRTGLPEAIDAAFALFVACRIPGEIIVKDRIKRLLQVDTLAQAVGTDQHALRRFGQLQHTLFAFRWWEQASDCHHLTLW